MELKELIELMKESQRLKEKMGSKKWRRMNKIARLYSSSRLVGRPGEAH
jgi:hypothetical protein